MGEHLTSLGAGSNALIVGASGGIGAALRDALLAEKNIEHVVAWSRRDVDLSYEKLAWDRVDITDAASIKTAADNLPDKLHLVIVATGLLHDGDDGPEKTWRSLEADWLLRNFAVNTVGPAMVARHVLGHLPRNERAIFSAISARVGSISDNRLGGWYGYRAAKAALNQIIRTLSIELARTHDNAVCVGLHPGTVDTALSDPFQANVPDNKLFTPKHAARHLLEVLDGLTPEDSGGLFAWDGERVPY